MLIPYEAEIISYFTTNYLSSNNAYWNTNNSLRGFDKLILKKLNDKISSTKNEKERLFLFFLEDLIRCIYKNFEISNRFFDFKIDLSTTKEKLSELSPLDAIKEFCENQNLFEGNAVIEFIEVVNKSINDSESSNNAGGISSWSSYLSDNFYLLLEKYEVFLKALSQFSSDSTPYGLLNFDWHNMSSGEKAYLNLFSRFYYAKEQILQKLTEPTFKGTENKLPDIIYILIDEGEIGFHLQWQKEYISKLHNVLPEILKFEGHEVKLQLIFTTHSPISLSDMLNDRVIYLKDRKVLKERR